MVGYEVSIGWLVMATDHRADGAGGFSPSRHRSLGISDSGFRRGNRHPFTDLF